MAFHKVSWQAVAFVVLMAVVASEAQRNNNRNNNRQNANRFPPPPPAPARRQQRQNGRFRATPANARDVTGNEVYPGCNGTVCLPVAQQCAIRKQKLVTSSSKAKVIGFPGQATNELSEMLVGTGLLDVTIVER